MCVVHGRGGGVHHGLALLDRHSMDAAVDTLEREEEDMGQVSTDNARPPRPTTVCLAGEEKSGRAGSLSILIG